MTPNETTWPETPEERQARKWATCEWCGKPFRRKTGPGRPRKYCTDECSLAHLNKVVKPRWEAKQRRRNAGRFI